MIDLRANLERTKSLTLPMSQIKVRSRNEFEVHGKLLRVTDSAFKDLLKLVGLTDKTVNHINQEIHRSAGFLLVKELMKAMAAKKGTNISLIISEEDMEVKRICLEGQTSGHTAAIAPAAIEELIGMAVSKNKNVVLTDTFIGDGGTKVTFNLTYDKPIPLAVRGEDISVGKQISWDMFGPTSVADFVERKICANGMTGIVPGPPTNLDNNSGPDDWYNLLYRGLVNPNQDWIKHYESKMFNAMQTNLSVYELNTILAHLLNNWQDDQPIITRHLGDNRWRQAYEHRGIDLDKLSAGQLRNCPTPVNAWDAINCLTDLSSHTYVSKVADRVRRSTQRMAGRLLNKTWDAAQQIFNLPTFPTRQIGTPALIIPQA